MLDCSQEWYSILPAIIGEDEGKKFTIIVNLGDSSSFLTFDYVLRKFELIPKSTHKAKEKDYSVIIELKNKNGAVSRIELRIYYICP